jgi:chromosome segregation ATPase
MARYFLKQSLVDEASSWYFEQYTIVKIVINVSAVVIAAAIDSLLNLAAFMGLLAGGLGALAHVVLTDHATVSNYRRQQISEDIKALEEDLKAEVEELGKVEDALNKALITLNEKIKSLSETNETLGNLAEELKGNVTKLIKSQEQFDNTNKVLHSSEDKLKGELTKIRESIKTLQIKLKEKIDELGEANKKLSASEEKLSTSLNDLNEVHESYKTKLLRLSELETQLERYMSLTDAALQEAEAQAHPYKPTPLPVNLEDIDALIAEGEAEEERAREAIRLSQSTRRQAKDVPVDSMQSTPALITMQ